jgi:TRAP-type C4-dicarboxylate transport system substrate-binding protein
MKLSHSLIAAAAVLGGLATASSAVAQEHYFRLHHLLSAQAPAHTQMLVPWAERVEELSGGAVDIEIFPAMTLGGAPPELISQARDGVVDIVWTVNGYTPSLFPRTEVIELPFVYTNDPSAANLALYDMFDEYLAQEYQGVEVMFLHVHAGQAIQMVDTEVRRPEDFEGLRMRIPTRTGAWVLEELGAQPVSMPVPDLPQALQTGNVAGALIPFEIIPPLRIQEQTQYQIELADGARLGTTTFQVSMNAERWNSLPEDIQAAFREASNREWWAEVGRIWADTDVFGVNFATNAGNEHVILTEEETEAFRVALEPVVQRWIDEVTAQGIDGAALVQRARELEAANRDM